MAEARRSSVKPVVKRLVCPCGAPVTVEVPARPTPTPAGGHHGPAQPKVMPCGACGRLLVVDDPNVGRVVLDKWRLERRLGQGGMGTVYLAVELSVDRPVALKFLHPHLAEREEYRTRFEQEARIMAKVEHPNLAGLYGVEREGASPFLVMKYVSGQPLSRVMKDKKVLSLAEALPLVVQMAAALSAVHAHGYVHRDLKPGNVMVGDDGHVTLLDFGLTRTHNPNLTRPGVALGSPQYMSPEQVLAGSLDARSDLYSLGLLTSELLVGRRPFKEEDTRALLLQHINEEPEPPHLANAAVPEAVSRVLLKALAKKPNDRQPSVEVFVEELLRAANVSAVHLPKRGSAEALVAGLSRPSPVPGSEAEVAEVVSHETGAELAAAHRQGTTDEAPELKPSTQKPTVPAVPRARAAATVPLDEPGAARPSSSKATVPQVPRAMGAVTLDEPPGAPAAKAAVPRERRGEALEEVRTDQVPAWHEKTDAVPAWGSATGDEEPIDGPTSPMPDRRSTVKLGEVAKDDGGWTPVVFALALLVIIVVGAAWILFG